MPNQDDNNQSRNNQGSSQNTGNFKNDPERAREAGKKGGNAHSRRGNQ